MLKCSRKYKIMSVVLMVLILAVGLSITGLAGDSRKHNEITLCANYEFSDGFFTIRTPENSTNKVIQYYLNNFYETLVNYEDGEFVPGLAKSWDISKDGLVYTFYLRKGVKFSDGSDFNAAVVKKNLEMAPVLLGRYNGSYGMVTTLFDKIKVIDDYTVEVHLTSPYYGALQNFARYNPLGIMSLNAFNKDNTLSDRVMETTLGTGPYMFSKKTDEGLYTFVQNPYYWGGTPDVDKIKVKVIPDNESKALALRTGEIDLIFGSSNISYDGFKEFESDSRFTAKASEQATVTRYLGLNTTKEPFNDKNVRLAVAHAIDKEGLCSNLFYGLEEEADSVFTKNLPYCNVDVEGYEYNLDKANNILEEAGYTDSDGDGIREKDGQGLEAEFLYISGQGSDEDLVLTLAAFLKKIGIEVRITGMEMMAWYSAVQQGNYDIVLGSLYTPAYLPYTFIENMDPENKSYFVATLAISHLENASEIITGLNPMVDENEIQARYNLILREINKNLALIPISELKELVVFNRGKIVDYEFYSLITSVNFSGIKLK